jgi:radical SAM protein with 4Fe4S-binding SPASM domain
MDAIGTKTEIELGWMKPLKAAARIPSLLLLGRFAYTFDGIPLRARNLPLAKRWNLILNGLNLLRTSGRLWGLPPTLQIEPTNMCNLQCPLCPSGTRSMKRKSEHMSLETFHRILADLEDVLVGVVLYGWGEPFLNHDLCKMIKACTDRGICTVTSTNGHYIDTLDKALELVDAGLGGITIAVDGSTQQIHRVYRKNGDLEIVKRCASLIEEAKSRRGAQRPYTNLRLVLSVHNRDDLPNVERLARELGVNMFSYKRMARQKLDDENYDQYKIGKYSLERLENNGHGHSRNALAHCTYPFRQPAVLCDGTVVACEYDYDMDFSWGRIGNAPFRSMWNSQEAIGMRRDIRSGHKQTAFCRRCPYQDLQGNSCVLSGIELQPLRH